MRKIDAIYDKFYKEMNFNDVIIRDVDGETFVSLPLPIEKERVDVLFISDNDPKAEAIRVRIFNIIELDESKKAAALELVNALNSEYKLLKFVLDSDMKISVKYDITMRNEYIENSVVELAGRIMNILEAVYPRLMKLKWS